MKSDCDFSSNWNYAANFNGKLEHSLTRMHSSWMRTARSLTVSHSVRWWGGGGSGQPPWIQTPPFWMQTRSPCEQNEQVWKHYLRKLRLRAVKIRKWSYDWNISPRLVLFDIYINQRIFYLYLIWFHLNRFLTFKISVWNHSLYFIFGFERDISAMQWNAPAK